MKRGISFLLAAVLLLTLAGCGGTGAADGLSDVIGDVLENLFGQ